jgi:hypothetical protein
VEEDILTREELLEQWRDAARAAQLAERLAKVAADGVGRADQAAAGAREIAEMAELVARSAEEAANAARTAAERAETLTREARDGALSAANQTAVDTKADESSVRDRYDQSESEAQERQRPN